MGRSCLAESGPSACRTLRPVRGESDADARAYRAAFSLPNRPPSRVTAAGHRQVMHAWPYHAELDWLIEDADGTPTRHTTAGSRPPRPE